MARLLSTVLVALTALAVGPASAATSGPDISPDQPAYVAPSRPYHTLHTRLDLDVDLRARHIAGSVTHTLRSLRDDLTDIPFNCVGLDIDSVRVAGEPATYDYPVPGGQTTSWLPRAGTSHADEMLVVHPAHALARGDSFEVAIYYHGNPKKGLYWIRPEKGLPNKRYEVWSQGEGEDNRYWIPCHDYPDEKATFEGIFRVPRGYYVLSNGVLASRRDVGERTEYTWRLDQPQASYLIMMAAAKYKVVKDSYKGIPVLYVVPPETDDATVRRGYGLTPDMMAFYAKITGIPYPFGKYAQVSVQNFIYGGMENTSATVMNMRTLYDEHAALTRDAEGLVAHELAHQWWGDRVTCRNWMHLWLNEGFATYYQSLYREHHDGEDAFRYEVHGRHEEVVRRDNKDPRPVVTQFYNRKDARNNANIYIKGSSVLHMLRFLIGDDAYHDVLHRYGEERKFKVADTSDLVRAVREITGRNLDWFFEQWIYLAGHPKFRVRKHWDDATHTLELSVRQTQKTGGLVPYFRVPLDVEFTCDDTVEVHRIVCQGESQDFHFPLPSRPLMVIFDKGDWNLKEVDFKRTTPELLYQLQHADYIARVEAAQVLDDHGGDEGVVEALAAAMKAPGHWGLRREAALSLGHIGTPAARDALLAGSRLDAGRVRLACAEALGDFTGDERAAKRLFEMLKTDPAYEVRAKAVEAMVAMRATHAADACEEALRQDSDQQVVRTAGLKGLAKLERTDELDRVARYAGPGNDRRYRHDAIAAYAELARHLDSDKARRHAADFLCGFLDDWFLRTREAAADALGKLGEGSAVSRLEQVASSDPLDEVRGHARRAIEHIQAHQDEKADEKQLSSQVHRLEAQVDSLQSTIQRIGHRGRPAPANAPH